MTEPLKALLLDANKLFYEVFASGDLSEMALVWSEASDISCIHPGWGAVMGREAVLRSWETILEHPPNIRCLEPRAFIDGTFGYVICFEDLGEGRLIASNFFRLENEKWRMIHHQAGVTRPDPSSSSSSPRQIH